MKNDNKTADAFATSWNNLPSGSVYTFDQFEDWMSPLTAKDVLNKRVLELGCGNGSLLVHMAKWKPSYLEGVDLGDSVISAKKNTSSINFCNIVKDNLASYRSNSFDLVYCIGVIHHLKNPKEGFESVIRNTNRGGKFHIWVYAREGNGLIVYLVDPIRKFVSKLPWWFTKYLVATPLTVPFYLYSNFVNYFRDIVLFNRLPLFDYSLWVSKRDFSFFRHVAFDQLVTPQTVYIRKETIEDWVSSSPRIIKDSVYIQMRNGNSWKFGGEIII